MHGKAGSFSKFVPNDVDLPFLSVTLIVLLRLLIHFINWILPSVRVCLKLL